MKRSYPQKSNAAFTLVELLVVIAVVAIGLTMLSSGLARSGHDVQTTLCLSSKRQMGMAWRLYSADNNGRLAPNYPFGGNDSGTPSWAAGWLDYTSGSDNTNADLLINHARYSFSAFLGSYVKTPAVFKCPADQSVAIPRLQNRVRSISLNNYLGDNARTFTTPSRFPILKKYSDIARPALVFTFLDEREDSINDGAFLTDPDVLYQMVDFPGNYHGNGCSFVFADNHTELHRWRDPRTMPLLKPPVQLPLNVNLPGDPDILWIAQHAVGVTTYP